MESLGIAGIVIVLAGLAGILHSLFRLVQLRKSGLDDARLRQRMESLLPINYIAFLVATVGFMLIIVDVII